MNNPFGAALLLSVLPVLSPAESGLHFDVPPGSHQVTLVFGSPDQSTETTVLAGSRQLMLEAVRTQPGESVVRHFHVNTRSPALTPPPAYAPGATAVELNERELGINRWDEQLTLHFTGANPIVKDAVVAAAPEVPVLYLLGDSTVTDQTSGDTAGWGQIIPRFFDGSLAVANHAESGETLKSFLFTNRLNKVLADLHPRDTVLIQFGHNDQKTQWPQTHVAADSTWPAYLRTYLTEIRRLGATPVLVTSMERRRFAADGSIRPTHGGYPQAVRKLAETENVPLIDLHAISIAFYEALGPKHAPKAFAQGGQDGTHHNAYGAYQLALAVAHEINRLDLKLAHHLVDELPPFDPKAPLSPDHFKLDFPEQEWKPKPEAESQSGAGN